MHEPPKPTPIELPRSFRVMEVASVAACFVLLGLLLQRVVAGASTGPLGVVRALIAAFLGYVAADFASGIVHFLADTFGSIETPLLGRKFILPFRSHHDRPHEITEHDFVETNGDSCFISLFVLVPVLWFVPVERGGGATLAGIFTLVMLVLVVFTNQFHKWAHSSDPPKLARLLQGLRLVLTPHEHAKHHRPPYVGRYCITSGVLNPLLDAVRFFPAFERCIRFFVGGSLVTRGRA